MAETQWMTLLETADLMKQLPDQVTRMCVEGKLEYYLEDGRYFVSRESIDLFMHSRTDDPAPERPDSNGTPRRQYGRAPVHTEHSSESVHETATVYARDEAATAETAETAGVVTNGDIADEAPGEIEAEEVRDEAATAETAETAGVVTNGDIADETHGEVEESVTRDEAETAEATETAGVETRADIADEAPGEVEESVTRDEAEIAETAETAGVVTNGDIADEAPAEVDGDLYAREAVDTYSFSGIAEPAGQGASGVTAGLTDEAGQESRSVPESSKKYGENELASTEDDEAGTKEGDAAAGEEEENVLARVDEHDAVAQVDQHDAVAQVDEHDATVRATEDDAVAGEDMEDTAAREVEEDTAAREVEEPASSTMDPVDPGAKTVEILADLRAALARHAQEHKAFCDEIAGLADALESTLSRGDDKTSELTREISSLLARYTRR